MEAATKIKFAKVNTLFSKVVFIDGTACVAKTLLGPILSTYKNVEIPKFEPIYEHIAILYHYKKITLDAAVTLMRNYLDESLYNSMIGRNINFRPSDLSSVFNGKNYMRYFQRLFMQEGEPAVQRIIDNKPVYQNLTHEILGFIKPCFGAFGRDFYVVELVRHPASLLNSWMRVGWGNDRFGLDPRSFKISFEYNGKQVPYFAYTFKELYHKMSPVERAINCINSCNAQFMKAYRELTKGQKERILFIKFEDLATNTKRELGRIKDFLSLEEGELLEEVIAEQRCPRKIDSQERDSIAAKHLENASADARKLFDRMSEEYEGFNPYNVK